MAEDTRRRDQPPQGGNNPQWRRGQQWPRRRWLGPDFRLQLDAPQAVERPGETITVDITVTARPGRWPTEAGRVFLRLNGSPLDPVTVDAHGLASVDVTISGDRREHSLFAYLEHMPSVRDRRRVVVRTDREIAELRRKLELKRLKRDAATAEDKAAAERDLAWIAHDIERSRKERELDAEKRMITAVRAAPLLLTKELVVPRPGRTFVVLRCTCEGKPVAADVELIDPTFHKARRRIFRAREDGIIIASVDSTEQREVVFKLPEHPEAHVAIAIQPYKKTVEAWAVERELKEVDFQIAQLEKQKELAQAEKALADIRGARKLNPPLITVAGDLGRYYLSVGVTDEGGNPAGGVPVRLLLSELRLPGECIDLVTDRSGLAGCKLEFDQSDCTFTVQIPGHQTEPRRLRGRRFVGGELAPQQPEDKVGSPVRRIIAGWLRQKAFMAERSEA